MQHIYFIDYLKDKAGVVLLNFSGLLLLILYLMCLQVNKAAVCIIFIAWVLIFVVYIIISYHQFKNNALQLFELINKLEKKYLLGELMPKPDHLNDRIYRELIKTSNRSVIEAIHELEQEHESYREYIEGWIHEIKTPITAIGLMCENQKSDTSKRIKSELIKIEDQVENVLYYARSNQVYEDYLIHEVNLKQVVLNAIAHYKQYFIQSGMQIDLEMDECMIPTDDKWVLFLLQQIFKNAIQYRKIDSPMIKISLEKESECVILNVEDNGIGIPQSELGRIFEKGFTGSNGRTTGKSAEESAKKSTGIGLYLCKKMCNDLKLGLAIDSIEGSFTRVQITFPYSLHQRILQK